jgi:hypothetical protein
MGGMGLVPRSTWKDLRLTSCINCRKRASNLESFGFWGKIPKIRIDMISREKCHKCMHIKPTT